MKNWNGKTILRNEIDLIIDSDASMTGLGASFQHQKTGGSWSAKENR